MSVVNIRVAHIRPQYANLKEWMEDPQNVYIGRGGIVFIDDERFPKKASVFCNPFKGEPIDILLAKYRKHLEHQLETGEVTKEMLIALKGKTLGCWCKPNGCHGDILLDFVNGVEA